MMSRGEDEPDRLSAPLLEPKRAGEGGGLRDEFRFVALVRVLPPLVWPNEVRAEVLKLRSLPDACCKYST